MQKPNILIAVDNNVLRTKIQSQIIVLLSAVQNFKEDNYSEICSLLLLYEKFTEGFFAIRRITPSFLKKETGMFIPDKYVDNNFKFLPNFDCSFIVPKYVKNRSSIILYLKILRTIEFMSFGAKIFNSNLEECMSELFRYFESNFGTCPIEVNEFEDCDFCSFLKKTKNMNSVHKELIDIIFITKNNFPTIFTSIEIALSKNSMFRKIGNIFYRFAYDGSFKISQLSTLENNFENIDRNEWSRLERLIRSSDFGVEIKEFPHFVAKRLLSARIVISEGFGEFQKDDLLTISQCCKGFNGI